MNSERWKQIEDIFQDALDLSGAARKNFIDEKTADDAELRAEVEKLVARFETEDEFLESPVWTDSLILGNTLKNRVASSLENEILPKSSEKNFQGKRVGVYRLTEEIGKGGMGVVYAAERADGEFKQTVAIKLIKRGMDTDFIVKRFRHERQILANLNHPFIARLLDGGTTDDDLPFFVMEFIDGKPLLKYCDEKKLDLREKLKLFLQVSAPIVYAHKRKIIHRDIKPSNILVNEDGEPKLLDFGIAKLLDADSIHESLLPTATAMRLMTPEYASPEQVRGEEITTASDQYSLGVLLYELITGERPYKFPSRAPHEIARVICEEIPSEPLSGSFEKLAARENLLDFDADFCKKLDRIVLKTLQKNPLERYESVEDFAADIERFLRNENVRAESFEKKTTSIKTSVREKRESEITKESAFETGGNQLKNAVRNEKEKTISPRRKGFKTGVFLIILSVISIPIFLLTTVTAIIPPPLITIVFLLFFFSGFVRILYALIFESGAKPDEFHAREKTEIAEAETKLINSSAPRETIPGNVGTEEKTAENEKSIAVLPFKNLNALSGDATGSSEFLSVGLADALTTRISNVRQLIVRPTSSVLKFGAGAFDSLEAGKELNVRFVVEGNIVKTEKRIRVSVQLLDVENRSTVWAEKFDEDLTDYLDLEDSISAKVVESLLPRISGEDQKQLEKRGTENSAAHEFYLRGRYYWNLFSESGFAQAIEFYRRAIDLDPGYAKAHAAIAEYYVWLGIYSILPSTEAYRSAQIAAERAIALDDRLAEAHAALGMARIYGEFDWQTGRQSMEYALRLNETNATAHVWYSYALLAAKDLNAAKNHIERSIELDPSSFAAWMLYGFVFYFARDFETALIKTDELLKRFPDFAYAYLLQASILRLIGRHDEAIAAARRAVVLSKGSLLYRYVEAQTLAAAGMRDETKNLLAEITAERRTLDQSSSNYLTAIVYCFLKEKEKAFDALEEAVARRDGLLIWIAVEPSFELIRQDARYQKLLEKMNHPLAGKTNFAARDFEDFQTRGKNKVQNKKEKSGVFAAFKYALFSIALIAFGLVFYNVVTHLKFESSSVPPEERWKNNFTSTMTARRLTTSGKVRQPVLSPDGLSVAYVSVEAGQQSLWIRPVDSNDARNLIAPAPLFYTDIKFSPDGKFLYYIRNKMPGRGLFRFPVSGGAEENVTDKAFNMLAFSPDGRRIVFDSTEAESNRRSLYIAQINEKSSAESAQLLFALESPDFFAGGLSFSPDAAKIVYSRSKIVANREVVDLYVYDFETKANERIVDRDFDDISSVAWRKGGEEIVVAASEKNSSPHQLWLVEYPSGDMSRLTNDFADYVDLELSGDSEFLVAERRVSASHIRTGEFSDSKKISESSLKEITSGVDRQDGLNGVNWTKDGRILYAAGFGDERNISIVNADGSGNRIIQTGTTDPAFPSMTSDNRFIVYADEKDQELNILRFDTTNGTTEKLNSKYAVTPAISPDDQTVVFAMMPEESSDQLIVHRKSLNDSGEATVLTKSVSVRPTVSPDSRFVACNFLGEETGGRWQIAVLPLNAKDVATRFIKSYTNNFFRNPQMRPLAWSPDGKSLYFLNYVDNVANIFRVGVENNTNPVQMTDFASGEIFDFALAADGKRVAVAYGATTADIVLFKKSQ